MIDYQVSVLDKRNNMRHTDLFHAADLFELIYSIHKYYDEHYGCSMDNLLILQILTIL